MKKTWSCISCAASKRARGSSSYPDLQSIASRALYIFTIYGVFCHHDGSFDDAALLGGGEGAIRGLQPARCNGSQRDNFPP